MSRRKVKFTKRLSVRLTALAAVLTLGALAIASAGFMPRGDQSDQGQEVDGGPATSSAKPPEPIPDIDDTELALTPPTADDAPDDSGTDEAVEQFAPPIFSMPSPNETVIRGNDGGEVIQASAEEPIGQPPSIYERNGGFEAPEPSAPPMELPTLPGEDASTPPAAPALSESATELPARLAEPTAGSPNPIEPSELSSEPSARSTSPMPEPLSTASDAAVPDAAAPATAAVGSAWGGTTAYETRTADDDRAESTAPPASFGESQFETPALAAPAEASSQPSNYASSAFGDTPGTESAAPLRSAAGNTVADDESIYTSPQAARFSTSGNVPDPSEGIEGDGLPGAEVIEGQQTPSLAIEKSAPSEIQVGKETEFGIVVRNVGSVAAHDVVIFDRVPRGTRFVSAQPAASRTPEGQLMWEAGTLQPGDERAITIQLLPIAEGEIGSVAQVLFQSQASVRTICTKPELTIKHTGPQKVLIGENITLDITISNPGTGAATSVVLEEDVPEGLVHAAGRELEREIGALRPGDTRQLQLTLTAEKPGRVQNTVLVRGDGNLIAHDALDIEVVAPALQVALSGPRLRYLDRPVTYDVAVSNPGTAPAHEVELVTYLPKGMQFVSADHKGAYEPQNHAVYWSLEELPANQNGSAKLTLLPLEIGEQKISLEGRAALGLQHADEKTVQVDSLAELQFTITDEHDPIEIGAETTYVVTLKNSGSSAATNIVLSVGLPPQLQAIGGDGPTPVLVEAGQLKIDTLERLGAGEEAVYKIRVQGLDAGPQRLQIQLVTAETPVPVTKEEITLVYADE